MYLVAVTISATALKKKDRFSVRAAASKTACEINGTFMRYQMTHQIHLAFTEFIRHAVCLANVTALIEMLTGSLSLSSGRVERSGTHLQLPLGQQFLSGPLVNVIRVTGLEGYSGHGSLTEADFPAHSPTEPPSSSLFKGTKMSRKN